MMDNERRADLGRMAVERPATETGVWEADDRQTAVTDVLAYIAHYCDRLGLDANHVFADGIHSYIGDFEDGPRAKKGDDE